MQPYQDFEEQEYDMVIDVPMDEIVTRTGTRTDKQVVSKIVEVEEERIYEMRPVLVGKGETRHRHIGNHHAFKHEHGKPEWDQDVHAGWLGKPQTPQYKPELDRPGTSGSVLGSKFDPEHTLLHPSATLSGSVSRPRTTNPSPRSTNPSPRVTNPSPRATNPSPRSGTRLPGLQVGDRSQRGGNNPTHALSKCSVF
eukprot:gnl/TRDRNA2_/TRDRNA2_144439_c3_seq1.p1 gnl/TRDRNA2_/TRDRNA2_144439_c3~~gnl/TRDRNA2_/TRDRNA2_144439_c3_seq1.p1  ORF type:complete len:196 (+),score=11.57 gnl/TRDRNA2_/TRDRNA2_144439_c3_seq1:2-589(+)